MSYEVQLRPRARKEFLTLPPNLAKQIADAFRSMEQNPRSHRSVKLSGVDSYRYRVGDYRILYEIDDHARKVIVYRIKHRREAYR